MGSGLLCPSFFGAARNEDPSRHSPSDLPLRVRLPLRPNNLLLSLECSRGCSQGSLVCLPLEAQLSQLRRQVSCRVSVSEQRSGIVVLNSHRACPARICTYKRQACAARQKNSRPVLSPQPSWNSLTRKRLLFVAWDGQVRFVHMKKHDCFWAVALVLFPVLQILCRDGDEKVSALGCLSSQEVPCSSHLLSNTHASASTLRQRDWTFSTDRFCACEL